jgi:hypothetical protein
MPGSKRQSKMDRCIRKVAAKGSVREPGAVCNAALRGKGSGGGGKKKK